MAKANSVLGKDFMMFVDGKALALATSCKLTVSAETIDTQSKDSGVWTEKDIKKLSWNGSSENLFSADENANNYDKLLDLMLKRKSIDVKFGVTASKEEDDMPADGWAIPANSYSGKVLITSLDLNAPDGDKVTFSATFEGTGALKPAVEEVTKPDVKPEANPVK